MKQDLKKKPAAKKLPVQIYEILSMKVQGVIVLKSGWCTTYHLASPK